jgi:hypothetical protein
MPKATCLITISMVNRMVNTRLVVCMQPGKSCFQCNRALSACNQKTAVFSATGVCWHAARQQLFSVQLVLVCMQPKRSSCHASRAGVCTVVPNVWTAAAITSPLSGNNHHEMSFCNRSAMKLDTFIRYIGVIVVTGIMDVKC